MSCKIYLESICDKCGTQTRDAHSVAGTMYNQNSFGPQDPPLPHGWCGVRIGAAATRHLCKQCTAQLREWLGMGPEAP